LKSLATDVCITTPSPASFVVSAQQAQANTSILTGMPLRFLKTSGRKGEATRRILKTINY
jgi:hypothetical protein